VEKIWLKSYPPGVPAEIDPGEFRSVNEIVAQACMKFAGRTAYVQMGKELGYRELERQADRFGAWLQKRAGIKKGERIALMMPNLLQYPIAMFGAMRAGLVIVNTNPLYTATELEHQLNDSGAVAIVILENFAHVLSQVIARTKVRTTIVTSVGEMLSPPKSWVVNYVVRYKRKQVPTWHIEGAVSFKTVLAEGRNLSLDAIDLGHDDIAFLQYTGGTTGVAKGAMLTHGNIVANIIQARAWIGGVFPPDANVLITPLPLYHIFGLTANCLLFMLLGWKSVLITNPRDFPTFVAELKKHRFSFITGVNTLFNALMHTPGFESIDFSALRIALGGGMAVQASVAERWKKMTGKPITQAWGLTETSPAACINIPSDDFNGSIGLPISSTEIAIKDDAGVDLPLKEVGELCVRGPQVMKGYWNRPDETEKVMLPEGWLRTGDIGHMDERGYVYIEDRKKDMINVSGFNVYPNEVEAAVASHPGVLEAAAVAQDDEHSGEVVALFVVRKDPTLTAEQIVEHSKQFLTGYKVPKHVYFRAELPKSNVGKILRRALRDELKH
jgi:long-chain acyl-CoA synthetase